MPESRATHARRSDPFGQALVIGTLATLTYAIIEGPRAGWGSVEIVALFAAAVACLAVLVPYELCRHEPLLELRFFRSAPFSGASAIAVCAFAATGGFLFLNTLYLQEVRHLSAFHAGLYMLPMAAMMFVVAPISGRLVGARGARPSLVLAGVAVTAGSLMLTRLTPHSSTLYLTAAYFIFGVGSGLVNPPITNTAVSGMPAAQAAVAAAVASTSRQVGMTLGVAVTGAIAGGSVTAVVGPQFATATHPGWWIVGALGTIILVLGFITTTSWAEGTAARTAARLRGSSRVKVGQPEPELARG